jgi:large subunit ribosomal protein L4
MPELALFDKTGKAKSTKLQAPELFDSEPNTHLIYLAEVLQLSNARQGSAHAKTRREVRGGGAKPWKQKGTGRARAGSSTSPLWKGGGVMHGPRASGTYKGRNWVKNMNNKEKILALISAINLAVREDRVAVIEELDISSGKTKELASIANAIGTSSLVLFVVDSKDKNLEATRRAARNIMNVKLITELELNVHDLLKAHRIVFTKAALEATQNRANSNRTAKETA